MLCSYCVFYDKPTDCIVGNIPLLDIYQIDLSEASKYEVRELNMELYGGFASSDLINEMPYLEDYEIWPSQIDFLFVHLMNEFYDSHDNGAILYNPNRILTAVDILLQVIDIAKDENYDKYKDIMERIERYDEQKELIELKKRLQIAIEKDMLVSIHLA